MTPVDLTLNVKMLAVWQPAHVWLVMKALPPAAVHSKVSVNMVFFFRAAGIKIKPVGCSFLFRTYRQNNKYNKYIHMFKVKLYLNKIYNL